MPKHLARCCGRLAVIATVALLSGGCATIADGTRQNVTVISEPPGADVFLNGQRVGTAPLVVCLNRRDEHIFLRFAKAGFVSPFRDSIRWRSGLSSSVARSE